MKHDKKKIEELANYYFDHEDFEFLTVENIKQFGQEYAEHMVQQRDKEIAEEIKELLPDLSNFKGSYASLRYWQGNREAKEFIINLINKEDE